MPKFGRRQYYPAGNPTRAEAPGMMKWLLASVVAIALIAGSFLSYRFLDHRTQRDPLLEKRDSFSEMVERHASVEELLRDFPSLDTTIIPIAFGGKAYKIPRNYLVDLDRRSADPKDLSFDIRVLLPDMVPRTAGTAEKFSKDQHGDQLNATIRGWQKELDLSARKLEWDRWCADKGRGAFRIIESGYRLCEAGNHELYLKDTTEGPLIFACDKITDKDPGCTIAEPTGAQWGVLSLEFSRTYIYQADDIRKRFRSLLDSFAEK